MQHALRVGIECQSREACRCLDGRAVVTQHLFVRGGRSALGVVGDVGVLDPFGRARAHAELLDVVVDPRDEPAGLVGGGRTARRSRRRIGGSVRAEGRSQYRQGNQGGAGRTWGGSSIHGSRVCNTFPGDESRSFVREACPTRSRRSGRADAPAATPPGHRSRTA
jgi:hypothetical protein